MRILFASVPIQSVIEPVLPLLRTAQQVGHTVALATGADGIEYVETAGATGIVSGLARTEILQRYASAHPDLARPDAPLPPGEKLMHMVVHAMAGIAAPAMADALVPLVRDWQPDVVVSGFSEFGSDSAVLYPRRWPIRPEGTLPHPNRPTRPAFPADLPYDRTVYVTAGTTWNSRPGVLEALLDTVRDEPVNAVMTVGRDVDPARFGTAAPHVRIVQYVPQADVLPFCDAVICHAGAGTVLGALAHGRPLVTLPFATDQHEIAAGVAASGAGVACSPWPAGADDLRDACRRVLSVPSYAEAAALMADEIAEMPSPVAVLTQLEEWVRAKA